jgi:hypothetical protein
MTIEIQDASYTTAAGRNLVARAMVSGFSINVYKAVVGNGSLPPDTDPETLTELVNYMMDGYIAGLSNPANGEALIRVQVSSAGVNTGFYVSELGLIADDEDGSPVMVAYTSLHEHPVWLRPNTALVNNLLDFNCFFIVQSAPVQAQINPSSLISVYDLGNTPGKIPVIVDDGKLDPKILPALEPDDTFIAGSLEEMLVLNATKGDLCIRSDENKTYVLKAEPASAQDNWAQMLHPAEVQSVNGKTGIVTISAGDLGLGSVSNTPDSAKNVNSASKLTTARTIVLTGDVTASGSFDGSANLSLPATAVQAAKLKTARTIALTGDATASGNFDGSANLSLAATVVQAPKLKTARTIALSGGATGTATNFDGSVNITIPVTALDISKANTGTLPITRGGTGATTAAAALSALGISVAASTITVQDANYATKWEFSYQANRVVSIGANYKKVTVFMTCTKVGSTGYNSCLDAVPAAYHAFGFVTIYNTKTTIYCVTKLANASCWILNLTGAQVTTTALGIRVGDLVRIDLDCWN